MTRECAADALALAVLRCHARRAARSGSGCAPAPLKAPAGGLKPIADVKAEGAAKAAAIKEQLLNRAAEIDRQAEERLAAVAAGVAPVEASVARLTVSDDEVARRKAYLLKQREALLAKVREALATARLRGCVVRVESMRGASLGPSIGS